MTHQRRALFPISLISILALATVAAPGVLLAQTIGTDIGFKIASREIDEPNAGFGGGVADAGDVNGDGYGDVVVVATGTGILYVYHGSSQGLPKRPSRKIVASVGPGFSNARAAGDVNGDGYDDVIAGAPAFDGEATNEGAAFLYRGSPFGLTPLPSWVVDPTDEVDGWFGISASGIGDVNSDGYDDVMVGANFVDVGTFDTGKVYAYYGSPSGLPATADWTSAGTFAKEQRGRRIRAAGDVNSDGFDDAMILTGSGVSSVRPLVFIVAGSATGLDHSIWSEACPGEAFSGGGDLNNDGYDDVVVGNWRHFGGEVFEGQVSVFLGSPTGPSNTPDVTVETDRAYTYFGFDVSSHADLNLDGFADIIVGAPFYDGEFDGEGSVFFLFGNETGIKPLAVQANTGGQIFTSLGLSVTLVPDMFGPGKNAAVAGAPGFDNPEVNEGIIYIYRARE